MGFQLGPGFLRRPPRGWLPARAFPVHHRKWIPTGGHDGESVIDMSCRINVLWRVEVEGREPYEVEEERTAPMWVLPNSFAGGGNRWYKVRLRRSFGLLPAVGVPCRVDPEHPGDLWVDWDAAYEEHEPAWAQQARVDRELSRRSGVLDQVVDRVTSPLAGRLKPEDEPLIEEVEQAERERVAVQRGQLAKAEEAQMAAMGFGPVPPEERERYLALAAAGNRIYDEGRPARATVVANEDTGTTLANIPVFHLTLDVDDGPGGPRRVVYEHVNGPRHAKRYKVGKVIDVRVDPGDPDAVTLAS